MYSHTRSRQGRLAVWRNARGVLDLIASGVTLYAVSSPGVTWCTDSSSCCLVIADSVLRLASKSRALLITCAKVRVVRFSQEMRSLLKCLKVSLRPITKMSLCSLHPLLMGNCISSTLVSLKCATVGCSSLGLVLRGEENYEWTVWLASLRDSGWKV